MPYKLDVNLNLNLPLQDPNPEDPLNKEAAEMLQSNPCHSNWT